MNWDKIVKYSLFLLVPTIAFRIEFEIMGAVLSPTELIIIFLLGITFVRYLSNPKDYCIKLIYLIPFLIFLVFAIPSRIPLLNVQGGAQGIWHIFRNFVELLPFVFLILTLNLKKKKQIKLLIVVLLIFTTISCALGIIQTASDGKYFSGIGVYGNLKYLGIFPPFPSDAQMLARKNIGRVTVITHTLGTRLFRAHGGLSIHNYLGAFLVLTLSISLSLALYKRSLLFSVLTILQFAGLAFTFTRSAYIGCFCAIFVILLMRKDWIKDIIQIGALIIVLLISIIVIRSDLMSGVSDRALSIFFNPKNPPVEVKGRLTAWEVGFKGIAETPFSLFFGHGTGGLKYFTLTGIPLTSHNDALDIIFSRGLISFLGIAILYILMLKDALYVFRKDNKSFFKGFSLGIFAGLIGLLVVGINQNILQVKDTGVLIWLIFGLMVSLKGLEKTATYEQDDI